MPRFVSKQRTSGIRTTTGPVGDGLLYLALECNIKHTFGLVSMRRLSNRAELRPPFASNNDPVLAGGEW